jgi:hypothetical protein
MVNQRLTQQHRVLRIVDGVDWRDFEYQEEREENEKGC